MNDDITVRKRNMQNISYMQVTDTNNLKMLLTFNPETVCFSFLVFRYRENSVNQLPGFENSISINKLKEINNQQYKLNFKTKEL